MSLEFEERNGGFKISRSKRGIWK